MTTKTKYIGIRIVVQERVGADGTPGIHDLTFIGETPARCRDFLEQPLLEKYKDETIAFMYRNTDMNENDPPRQSDGCGAIMRMATGSRADVVRLKLSDHGMPQGINLSPSDVSLTDVLEAEHRSAKIAGTDIGLTYGSGGLRYYCVIDIGRAQLFIDMWNSLSAMDRTRSEDIIETLRECVNCLKVDALQERLQAKP